MFFAMLLKAPFIPIVERMLTYWHGKQYSIVISTLPEVLSNLSDVDGREKMAWADTLAGLCIANAGVTLPHGMGMAIGGMYPHIAHGEALAIVYPSFMRFTWESAIPQFSKLAWILDPDLKLVSEAEAAERSAEEIDKFLKSIGLWISLQEKGMAENEIEALAVQSMVLPDYKGNLRVATREEMIGLVKDSFYKK